jgi:hypothetical protein
VRARPNETSAKHAIAIVHHTALPRRRQSSRIQPHLGADIGAKNRRRPRHVARAQLYSAAKALRGRLHQPVHLAQAD